MKQILTRRDGYILVWVLVVFLVVALASTVMISYAVASSNSTRIQHNARQSYFTAKSAAQAVADYIAASGSGTAALQGIAGKTGSGSLDGMGEYTVQVDYVTEEKIRVKAEAYYNGEQNTVTVYLIRPPMPSGVLPTDNVIYLNGDATSGFGQVNMHGDVFINGNLSLGQGSSIRGFVAVQGTTTISGAGHATNGLYSAGSVYMDGSATIDGDLLTKGDVTMNGSATISGMLHADGSLMMYNGVVQKDALVQNDAFFSGGSDKIKGVLQYGGTVTVGWGSVTTFVPKGASRYTVYTPVDDSKYGAQVLPPISVPTQSQMPELYNAVVIKNNVISNSGTITSAVMTQLSQAQWGTVITIDATKKDISLLLDNTNFSLNNGLNIEVNSDGTHNVYLYLKGNSNFSVNSNEYVGMKVRGSNPRLFLFGDGEQTVSLNANSELDACVYIPNGTFRASGSPLTTYKFIGSCIVKTIDVNSNVTLFHSKPDVSGTPLAIFSSGGTSSQSGSWRIESWDNK